MKLLDGKVVSEAIKTEIAGEVSAMLEAGKRAPHLAAILVGEDPASQTYVASKEKACREVGFMSSVYRYPAGFGEKQLLEAVHFLNQDPEVDGFIVQLPLPANIHEQSVISAINPTKDVDGFHPENLGKMLLGQPCFLPATPYGILMLLEHYKVETAGKHVVVLGRSNIVGTPISIMLGRKTATGNATVTLCHSYTQNLSAITQQADILIAAIGKMHFVTADMVKPGAVVVDVGIHRISDESKKSGFRLTGDVDFDAVAGKCSLITPVPGGVGLMTIVGLLKNTLLARKEKG